VYLLCNLTRKKGTGFWQLLLEIGCKKKFKKQHEK